MLWWSLKAFREEDPSTRLVLVLPKAHLETWRELEATLPQEERFDCLTAFGGGDRCESVANALTAIAKELEPLSGLEDSGRLESLSGLENSGRLESLRGVEDSGRKRPEVLVAIHDGARPLIEVETIRRGWECARKNLTAVPAVPLTDSIRKLKEAGKPEAGSESADRTGFVAVQTPQVFDHELLRKAYALRSAEGSYTDDASVVEPLHPIALYPGSATNMKVTYPSDFALAELLLAERKR